MCGEDFPIAAFAVRAASATEGGGGGPIPLGVPDRVPGGVGIGVCNINDTLLDPMIWRFGDETKGCRGL